MDSRTKNSLPIVGEFTKERHDGPGRLGVEARCGFVEEKQQFRLSHTLVNRIQHGYNAQKSHLGRELDTDSSAFPVLHTKRSNDGIRVGFQATHFQTLVDAIEGGYQKRDGYECSDEDILCFFLSHWNRRGLSKSRRKQKGLAHCRLCDMSIYLLDVCRLGPEVRRERMSIH